MDPDKVQAVVDWPTPFLQGPAEVPGNESSFTFNIPSLTVQVLKTLNLMRLFVPENLWSDVIH